MSSLPSLRALWMLACSMVAGGCAGGYGLVPRPLDGSGPASVRWYGPERAGDAAALKRWGESVGPPVVLPLGPAGSAADRLVVVSWNVNVGAGDVGQLFMDITARAGPDVPIVMLLQEAYRSGTDVPGTLGPGATFAARILGARGDGRRDEVREVAAALGLHAYYVPSKRNGSPLASDEDRGNAILSTAPLADLLAIELPFERQRRVAVGATVRGRTRDGAPWQLRVVSAHLDTRPGVRRLSVLGSELARTRQARGLVSVLGEESPTVLGADLNTFFGFADRAYLETALAFPDTHVTDYRRTFRGLLRLDHLFFRLDDGWTATFHRAENRYGSDHHPLIGTVTFR